jgi:hypothetical protein
LSLYLLQPATGTKNQARVGPSAFKSRLLGQEQRCEAVPRSLSSPPSYEEQPTEDSSCAVLDRMTTDPEKLGLLDCEVLFRGLSFTVPGPHLFCSVSLLQKKYEL